MNAEHLSRPSVEAVDSILGKRFPVLDDGFVRVVDYMGDDTAVVSAARVSYGAGTKKVSDDHALIRYLMRHHHTTPFEMCEIKLHARAPMDTWRQWVRHRTASVNEYSTRYSLAIDASQRTKAGDWRLQSTENRQGSSGFLEDSAGANLSSAEEKLQQHARQVYEERLAAGVAREQARKDLPLATYTEAYWKVDLHNLLNFLQLRMHKHAQVEIRNFANIIGHEIVSKWVPAVWQAFLDYRNQAVNLSRMEAAIIAAIAAQNEERARDLANDFGLLTRNPDGSLKANRERRELEEKLSIMGIAFSWI
jgi:thymidylate synthase (FAD)